jgi:hypothetical protein
MTKWGVGYFFKDSVRKIKFCGSVQIKYAITYIFPITVVLLLSTPYS